MASGQENDGSPSERGRSAVTSCFRLSSEVWLESAASRWHRHRHGRRHLLDPVPLRLLTRWTTCWRPGARSTRGGAGPPACPPQILPGTGPPAARRSSSTSPVQRPIATARRTSPTGPHRVAAPDPVLVLISTAAFIAGVPSFLVGRPGDRDGDPAPPRVTRIAGRMANLRSASTRQRGADQRAGSAGFPASARGPLPRSHCVAGCSASAGPMTTARPPVPAPQGRGSCARDSPHRRHGAALRPGHGAAIHRAVTRTGRPRQLRGANRGESA